MRGLIAVPRVLLCFLAVSLLSTTAQAGNIYYFVITAQMSSGGELVGTIPLDQYGQWVITALANFSGSDGFGFYGPMFDTPSDVTSSPSGPNWGLDIQSPLGEHLIVYVPNPWFPDAMNWPQLTPQLLCVAPACTTTGITPPPGNLALMDTILSGSISPVPEPAFSAPFFCGLLALWIIRRRDSVARRGSGG